MSGIQGREPQGSRSGAPMQDDTRPKGEATSLNQMCAQDVTLSTVVSQENLLECVISTGKVETSSAAIQEVRPAHRFTDSLAF